MATKNLTLSDYLGDEVAIATFLNTAAEQSDEEFMSNVWRRPCVLVPLISLQRQQELSARKFMRCSQAPDPTRQSSQKSQMSSLLPPLLLQKNWRTLKKQSFDIPSTRE